MLTCINRVRVDQEGALSVTGKFLTRLDVVTILVWCTEYPQKLTLHPSPACHNSPIIHMIFAVCCLAVPQLISGLIIGSEFDLLVNMISTTPLIMACAEVQLLFPREKSQISVHSPKGPRPPAVVCSCDRTLSPLRLLSPY